MSAPRAEPENSADKSLIPSSGHTKHSPDEERAGCDKAR
jgi:hypothetical protein